MKRSLHSTALIVALIIASANTVFSQAKTLDEYGLRAGHSAPINVLDFSADGRVLHSAASDSSWRAWDASSGKALAARVIENPGWVGGAIDPAASRVLMRADTILRVFDLATGEKVGGASHKYDTSIVAFAPSPDWSYVVSSDRRGDAIIWDLKTGKEMMRKRVNNYNLVSGFTFSRGGAAILCNTGLSGVYLWYPSKGEIQQAIPTDFVIEPNPVLTVGKDGADGFIALREGRIEHWDVVTGILNKAPLRVLDGKGAEARVFAVANDAGLAAAAFKDGTVKVWRLADGFQVAEFKAVGNEPDALAIAPGGKALAVASGQGELEVWDLGAKRQLWRAERHDPKAPMPIAGQGTIKLSATGKKLILEEAGTPPRSIGSHEDFINAIALSEDGRVAASAAWGGGIALWETATGKALWKGSVADRSHSALALSSDGDMLAEGFADGSCLVLDTASGRELASLPSAVDSPVASIALSPDGARAAVLHANKRAALFDVAGSAMLVVTSDTYDVRLPAFSADGRSAALYAWGRSRKDGWLKDSGVMVFSPLDAKTALRFHKEPTSDEDNAVTSLALSPDGAIVAAGTKSGKGYAYLARYGTRFDLKSPLPGPVSGIAFLPGGETRFRAAGAEASLAAKFPRHFDAIGALAFSADGKALYSGGADGDVRAYGAATGAVLGSAAVGVWPIVAITASADGARLDIKEKGYYSHAISPATLQNQYDYYILGPYNFVSADGKTHYVVKENDVDVYTFPEKVLFRKFEKPEYKKMVAADMSPDAQWLFIAFEDLSLHGWELDTPKKLTDTMFGVPKVAATTVLQKLPAAPGFLAAGIGGKRVALAMPDGAWLMDPKSRKPVAVLPPTGGYVCALAFSCAGDRLAVADSSGKVSVYETAKGKQVRTLAAQSGVVSAVAFSRDGKLLAVAGADRAIRVFELATGTEQSVIAEKE